MSEKHKASRIRKITRFTLTSQGTPVFDTLRVCIHLRDKDGLCVYEPKPSDPMNKQNQKQNSLLSLFLAHYCHICTQNDY